MSKTWIVNGVEYDDFAEANYNLFRNLHDLNDSQPAVTLTNHEGPPSILFDGVAVETPYEPIKFIEVK